MGKTLSYKKGVAAEQQLIRLIKDRDYEFQRAAGSRGAADILCAKKGLLGLSKKKFAIQVKATNKDKFVISKDDIERLKKFADKFDSIAVLAIRFSGERWRFWDNEEESFHPMFGYSAFDELKGNRNRIEVGVNDKIAKKFEKIF
jgi:Holliday junction resolvase